MIEPDALSLLSDKESMTDLIMELAWTRTPCPAAP